jgi:RND family efflux transporter MFP subunit
MVISAQPAGVTGPAPVAVGFVQPQRFAESQSFVGSIKAICQVTVGTAVEGRVVQLLVQPGERVVGPTGDVPGTVLAQLDTGMLQIEIDAAKIQLDLIEQAAAELDQIIPEELAVAESKLAESRAKQDQTEKELERLERLAQQVGAVAALELEQARSAALAQRFLSQQLESDIRRLQSTRALRITQSKLRIDAAKQDVIRLEDQKRKHQVRAPFTGYVTNKLTEVGAWATRGAPVVDLVQVDTMELIFNVPQEYVERVVGRLAQTDPAARVVTIQVDGVQQTISGVLQSVIPQADERSRMFPVRCTFENPLVAGQPLLQSGMLARASLAVGLERDRLLIKKDALVLGGREPLVFKVPGSDAEAKVISVPVKTGQSLGDWIEVQGDLKAGERIVLLGNERLRNDQAVRITQTSDETPPTGL